MTRCPGLVAPLLALCATPAAAQVVLTGQVREDGSRRPLAGVQVLIEGVKRDPVTTDSGGKFRLDAPSGNRVALFRMIGYQPLRLRLQLTKGDTVEAVVELVKEGAQQLEPLETTARMPGPRGVGIEAFEERRFVENPSTPRVYEWRAASGRKQTFNGSPCWMSVVVDGSPIYRSGSSSLPPDFHKDMFPVSSLSAVEIYRSPAEVPQEYGGPSEECGLILLWTRRS